MPVENPNGQDFMKNFNKLVEMQQPNSNTNHQIKP
jgi:hypothetical protein